MLVRSPTVRRRQRRDSFGDVQQSVRRRLPVGPVWSTFETGVDKTVRRARALPHFTALARLAVGTGTCPVLLVTLSIAGNNFSGVWMAFLFESWLTTMHCSCWPTGAVEMFLLTYLFTLSEMMTGIARVQTSVSYLNILRLIWALPSCAFTDFLQTFRLVIYFISQDRRFLCCCLRVVI